MSCAVGFLQQHEKLKTRRYVSAPRASRNWRRQPCLTFRSGVRFWQQFDAVHLRRWKTAAAPSHDIECSICEIEPQRSTYEYQTAVLQKLYLYPMPQQIPPNIHAWFACASVRITRHKFATLVLPQYSVGIRAYTTNLKADRAQLQAKSRETWPNPFARCCINKPGALRLAPDRGIKT